MKEGEEVSRQAEESHQDQENPTHDDSHVAKRRCDNEHHREGYQGKVASEPGNDGTIEYDSHSAARNGGLTLEGREPSHNGVEIGGRDGHSVVSLRQGHVTGVEVTFDENVAGLQACILGLGHNAPSNRIFLIPHHTRVWGTNHGDE